MSDQDIHWQQRFLHFEKAFLLLQDAVSIEKPSIVERAGLIQFFERSFDLSWKLLKDFLEAEGFTPASPKAIITHALESNLISESHDWLDAIEGRRLTMDTYNEATALDVERRIRIKYFPRLQQLHRDFSVRVSCGGNSFTA